LFAWPPGTTILNCLPQCSWPRFRARTPFCTYTATWDRSWRNSPAYITLSWERRCPCMGLGAMRSHLLPTGGCCTHRCGGGGRHGAYRTEAGAQLSDSPSERRRLRLAAAGAGFRGWRRLCAARAVRLWQDYLAQHYVGPAHAFSGNGLFRRPRRYLDDAPDA